MSKYKAKKVEIDGIKFDSIVESKYYIENKSRIVKVHPRYILVEKFEYMGESIRGIEYEADFKLDSGEVVDIKGMATSDALIKRKLFMNRYRDIRLVWLVYIKKRGGWIDYFKNKEIVRGEKRLKNI